MEWYTVKIKYYKEYDDGSIKRVTEPYLLQAATFTDAEARIHEEVLTHIRGDFLITNIAKTDFADIFYYDDADQWHKCKLQYVDINPDNGKEKKITQQFLVTAHNVKEAFDRMHESLRGMLTSFELPSIMQSPIVDVFPFTDEAPEDRVITDEEKETREKNTEEGVADTEETEPQDTEDEDSEEETDQSYVSDEYSDSSSEESEESETK